MFARLLYHGVQRRLVGYAGGDGDGALSPAPRVDGGRHLLAGLLLAAGNHHIGARLRKCFRNGAPDAAGRAGDDRGLAAQVEQIHALLPFGLPAVHELTVGSSARAMQARLHASLARGSIFATMPSASLLEALPSAMTFLPPCTMPALRNKLQADCPDRR